MNDNELTDVLERIVPAGPEPTGWARTAVRRSRTRRAIAPVAATALVLFGGAALVLNLSTPPRISVTPANPSGPAASWRDACFTPDGRPVRADLEIGTAPTVAPSGTPGNLPDGATRAWLCGDNSPTGHPDETLMLAGPRDPLTVGVESLVAGWNALPAASDPSCRASGDFSSVVVEYGDGQRRVLTLATGDCDVVSDGAGKRTGAASLLRTAVDLWTQQRRTTPPGDVEGQRCMAQRSVLPVALADVSRGVSCVRVGEMDKELPGALLDKVIRAVAAEAVTEGASDLLSPITLVLWNRFGDPLTLQADDDGTWHWTEAGQNRRWSPSPALKEELATQLGLSEWRWGERLDEGDVPLGDDVAGKLCQFAPGWAAIGLADVTGAMVCGPAAQGVAGARVLAAADVKILTAALAKGEATATFPREGAERIVLANQRAEVILVDWDKTRGTLSWWDDTAHTARTLSVTDEVEAALQP